MHPFTIEGTTLTISHVVITDDVTIGYLEQMPQEEQLPGLINCIQFGARALTFVGDQTGAALLADTMKLTTESTRTLLSEVSKTTQKSLAKSAEELPLQIHRQLETLRKDLEKTLDPQSAGSIIGKLRTALLDDYRKVTSKAREDLDLANPNSPLSMLQKLLEKQHAAEMDQIAELLRQNAAKAAAGVERAKGTRKGTDFETVVESFLTSECAPRKDLVRRTSTERGDDGSLVGDMVVDLNPSEAIGLRIALEVKDSDRGTTALIRELDKAVKNRSACFGITVKTDPTGTALPIIPFGDDKMIVNVTPLPDGDGWDMLPLGVALSAARWKALIARASDGKLDITRIQADVEAAFAMLNRITEVKKRISSGKTHLDGIAEYVDDMRRDLTAVLQRLREQVTERPKAA